MIKRALAFVLMVTAGVASLLAQRPAPQTEFVPIDQLPPGDQLPSAPLLIAAYAFVWLATLFYVWTVWRRLTKVEREIRGLEQRRTAGTRK